MESFEKCIRVVHNEAGIYTFEASAVSKPLRRKTDDQIVSFAVAGKDNIT